MSGQPDLDRLTYSYLSALPPDVQTELLEDQRNRLSRDDYDYLLGMVTRGEQKSNGRGFRYPDPKPQT